MELGHHLRLPRHQLGVQQLAEQVVVAVPLPPGRAGSPAGCCARADRALAPSLRADGDVAERPRDPLEDRGAGEERHIGSRDAVEELRAEVVGHEAVVAGERVVAMSPGELPAFMARAARYSPAGHPSVRSTRASTSGSASSTPAAVQQRRRPRPTSMARSSTPISTRPPLARRRGTGSGSSWRDPMARRRTGRQPHGQLGDHVAGTPGSTSASAWSSTTAMGASIDGDRQNPGGRRRPAGTGRRPGSRSTLGLDRLDPVERHGEVREEHGGVVVAIVEGQPGHPGCVRGRPLRQHRRLAVPGGSDDRDHGSLARTEQPLDDRGAVDDAGSDRRGGELRLVELEGEHPPTSMCPCGGRASTAGGPCRHETDGTSTGRGVRAGEHGQGGRELVRVVRHDADSPGVGDDRPVGSPHS